MISGGGNSNSDEERNKESLYKAKVADVSSEDPREEESEKPQDSAEELDEEENKESEDSSQE